MDLGTATCNTSATAAATALIIAGGLTGEGDGYAAPSTYIGGTLRLSGAAQGSSAPVATGPGGCVNVEVESGSSAGASATNSPALLGTSNPAPITGHSTGAEADASGSMSLLPSLASTIYGATWIAPATLHTTGGLGSNIATGSATNASSSARLSFAGSAAGYTTPAADLNPQHNISGAAAGATTIDAPLTTRSQLGGHSGSNSPQLAGVTHAMSTPAGNLTITGQPNVALAST